MMDKNFWWKILLIAGITGLAFVEIYPPSQRLKGGIDLMGGHSLLYEIDDTGIDMARRRDLSQRVMQILKERVDPKGQRNLVWRPVGANRLEIQIPKPPEEVVRVRDAYKTARNELAATELTRNQVRLALAQAESVRAKALQDLVRGDTSREPLLAPLAEAYKKWQDLQAKAPGTDQTEDAYEVYKAAEDRLIKTNIGVERLEDILSLGPGEAREKALQPIYQEHPSLRQKIDGLAVAYDPWNRQRGALDDPADLKRLLLGAGVLDFRILPTPDPQNPLKYESYVRELQRRGPRSRPEDLYAWFEIKNPASFLHMEDVKNFEETFEAAKKAGNLHYVVEKYADRYYVLASNQSGEVMLHRGQTRWSLVSATASRDPQTNQPCVLFSLDGRGGNLFEALTRANLNRPLCILLDDVAYSAPNIKAVIRESGTITGDFTVNDVMYLVNTLEAGSLPARLKPTPIMEKSIGPSLGLTNRTKGLNSGILGVALVVVFMLVYYLYGGFIANLALMLNLLYTLAIMAMLQATFTLAGIAGLMLSLGMAVDANVLIYERMREEFQRGVGLRLAIKAGYDKALSAIVDSNVTTMITCVILGYVGTEEIKGFAYTLGFGIATSMFTALFVTRQFFALMIPERLDRSTSLYPLYGVGVLAGVGAALYVLTAVLFRHPNSPLANLGMLFLACGASGLGLLGLMWLCRIALRTTRKWHPNTLPMLHLIRHTNIDWMGLRRVFWPVSAVLVFSGLGFFAYQNRYHADNLYDIEFLGGTSTQIQVKPDSPLIKGRKDQDEVIREKITGVDKGSAAGWLLSAAQDLERAEVKAGPSPDEFLITSKELNARQIQSLLLAVFEDRMQQGEEDELSGHTLAVHTKPDAKVDLEGVRTALRSAARYARSASDKLRHASVQIVQTAQTAGEGERGPTFEVVSTETDARIMRETIVASLGDDLVIQPAVSLEVLTDPNTQPTDPAHAGMYPIEKPTLGEVLRNAKLVGSKAATDISAYNGGVAFVVKDLNPPITAASIHQRLQRMRLQPDFEAYAWRDFRIIPLAQTDPATPGSPCTAAAVVVADEHNRYDDSPKNWRANLAEPEVRLARAALETGKSLQEITRFSPSVAEQGKTRALAAVVLALAVTIAYIWFRFGSITLGLCNIAALIHDVCLAIGMVALSHFLNGTFIGRALEITDFRVDLTIVAAILTIIGYSQNDTIVIFDRIREVRGKLATIDAKIVSDSINQTLSRTILTVLTVFLVLLTMYIWGGPGIHAFNYAMLIGVLTGAYSSIAIAGALAITPSALRLFYYVLTLSILIMIMAAAGIQWEGAATIAGGGVLLAVLCYGELTVWRNKDVPGDLWLASFGWLGVVSLTWVLTMIVASLAPSTAHGTVWIRGLVSLGAAVAASAMLLRAMARERPVLSRAMA